MKVWLSTVDNKPRVMVLSSLFPSTIRPTAGLFVQQRMFRVAQHAELFVVSPVPWFPGQGLLRLLKPDYRPMPSLHEQQQGIDVYFPRFLAIPGLFRQLDGWSMARSVRRLLKKHPKPIDIIDSHFTFPDGYAAATLGRWLDKQVTITLRGTELKQSHGPLLKQLKHAWNGATKLFAVSESLRQIALEHGIEPSKCKVIGNGIDTDLFIAADKEEAKAALGIDKDCKVLITVGGLVERKGFHRVVACLPELLKEFPKLVYLIVGGANPEGNYRPQIEALSKQLGVEDHVRFLGALSQSELSLPLSAANVFVLATSNEGWANVILEAMACNTPVVATDVGGNSEVVSSDKVGSIVPFGDSLALQHTLCEALKKKWHNQDLQGYVRDNHWDRRINMILNEYQRLKDNS
jgi:glycosyltransferase involved in cell wall biosynthesis